MVNGALTIKTIKRYDFRDVSKNISETTGPNINGDIVCSGTVAITSVSASDGFDVSDVFGYAPSATLDKLTHIEFNLL